MVWNLDYLFYQLSQTRTFRLWVSLLRDVLVDKDREDVFQPKILSLDLEELESLESKAREALSLFGGVDIIVNNAGMSVRYWDNSQIRMIINCLTQGRSTGDRGESVQPSAGCQLSRLCGAHPSPPAPDDLPRLRTRRSRLQCAGPPPNTGQGSLLWQVGWLVGLSSEWSSPSSPANTPSRPGRTVWGRSCVRAGWLSRWSARATSTQTSANTPSLPAVKCRGGSRYQQHQLFF